ncbi:MAG: hypothetical protein V3S09_02375 [Candidatus Bathyarchaeia archaeon]
MHERHKIGYDGGGYMKDIVILGRCLHSVHPIHPSGQGGGIGEVLDRGFRDALIWSALDVPEDYDVVVVSPFSYPKSEKAFCETDRIKVLSEIVSQERFWGQSFPS